MKIVQLVYVFIIAFFLNFIWEHAHAVLYASYQGSAITNAVLLHATFVDALIIIAAGALYFFCRFSAQDYISSFSRSCASV